MLNEVFSVPMSLGGLSNCKAQLTDVLEQPYNEAAEHVREQDVGHADEIKIDTLRDELRKAQFSPEKIRIKIKRLIAIPDYPEKLIKMVEKAVTSS